MSQKYELSVEWDTVSKIDIQQKATRGGDMAKGERVRGPDVKWRGKEACVGYLGVGINYKTHCLTWEIFTCYKVSGTMVQQKFLTSYMGGSSCNGPLATSQESTLPGEEGSKKTKNATGRWLML